MKQLYQLGLRKMSRANEELLSDASYEELQALLALYMRAASEPLPEDPEATVEVSVRVLKPMAALGAQTLTRILSKRNPNTVEEETDEAPSDQ